MARRGFRVTSGCAPVVGIPAVEAAFKVAPTGARFYLRLRGGTTYRRTAPAIVVGSEDIDEMRKIFIPEVSTLVAMGGRPTSPAQVSGTIQEIEMALSLGIPVLLLPQVGGDVAVHYERLRAIMNSAYKDEPLRCIVGKANDDLRAVGPDELLTHARTILGDQIESILSTLMGAAMAIHRGASASEW